MVKNKKHKEIQVNDDQGKEIAELVEWLRKVDLTEKKAIINMTSIEDNNGGRIIL